MTRVIEKLNNAINSRNNSIRILVSESSDLVRYGLRALFTKHDILQLAAETRAIDTLPVLMVHYQPDIVLMNCDSANSAIYAFLKKLANKEPKSKIIVLHHEKNAQMQSRLLTTGIAGVVSLDSSAQQLVKTIHSIHSIHRNEWNEVYPFKKHNTQHSTVCSAVTPLKKADGLFKQPVNEKEHEIINLICQGLPVKVIAAQLSLSEKTIRNRLSTIYRKVAVSNKVGLFLKVKSKARISDLH